MLAHSFIFLPCPSLLPVSSLSHSTYLGVFVTTPFVFFFFFSPVFCSLVQYVGSTWVCLLPRIPTHHPQSPIASQHPMRSQPGNPYRYLLYRNYIKTLPVFRGYDSVPRLRTLHVYWLRSPGTSKTIRKYLYTLLLPHFWLIISDMDILGGDISMSGSKEGNVVQSIVNSPLLLYIK